ncbi:beta-defensin 123 [Prionailurus viverrinus]|uniref:Beta-defensin n=3 Tax=Felinae TaxID=338152 RepID=A0A6J0A782_ACIJB|nr:beta-defensin 123 [Acinonyx jubatus]XP_025788475.1 beta-defensin 123 [Puma concolor]XP_030167622.1 beta-defensin 123 [Lynx canadensis]XP_040302707.1 beta-defensin 123 isoform X1 [Puma yagouaroundi]XP_043458591.1 beta-defensin 123 [Prionailurus bengalensis]XP_046925109.1 beta-defensin 123 [Lynx rufus]XP_047708954.1 beta-defensin 123 [Prionailurus viverrinus]
MKLLSLTLAALLLLSQLTPGSTQKCWNLHGKCRQKCSRKERIYVYCTNNKLCCVKPKYQPREKLWSSSSKPEAMKTQMKLPSV